MEKQIVNRCGGKKSGCSVDYVLPYSIVKPLTPRHRTDNTPYQRATS